MSTQNIAADTVPAKFELKDRNTILALITLGHSPMKIEPIIVDGGQRVLLFHFEGVARPDYERYLRGEEILVDIRKYEAAERVFKNNIKRYSAGC